MHVLVDHSVESPTAAETSVTLAEQVKRCFLDDALMSRLRCTAARCSGQSVDSLPVREIATDVLTDLLMGKLAVPFDDYEVFGEVLRRLVKRRAKDTRKGNNATTIALELAPAEALSDTAGEHEPDHYTDARAALPLVVERAGENGRVKQLLDRYSVLSTSIDEVPRRRHVTARHDTNRMNIPAYKKARERLDEYVRDALATVHDVAEHDE